MLKSFLKLQLVSPVSVGLGGPFRALFSALSGIHGVIPFWALCPLWCLVLLPLTCLFPAILPIYLLFVLQKSYKRRGIPNYYDPDDAQASFAAQTPEEALKSTIAQGENFNSLAEQRAAHAKAASDTYRKLHQAQIDAHYDSTQGQGQNAHLASSITASTLAVSASAASSASAESTIALTSSASAALGASSAQSADYDSDRSQVVSQGVSVIPGSPLSSVLADLTSEHSPECDLMRAQRELATHAHFGNLSDSQTDEHSNQTRYLTDQLYNPLNNLANNQTRGPTNGQAGCQTNGQAHSQHYTLDANQPEQIAPADDECEEIYIDASGQTYFGVAEVEKLEQIKQAQDAAQDEAETEDKAKAETEAETEAETAAEAKDKIAAVDKTKHPAQSQVMTKDIARPAHALAESQEVATQSSSEGLSPTNNTTLPYANHELPANGIQPHGMQSQEKQPHGMLDKEQPAHTHGAYGTDRTAHEPHAQTQAHMPQALSQENGVLTDNHGPATAQANLQENNAVYHDAAHAASHDAAYDAANSDKSHPTLEMLHAVTTAINTVVHLDDKKQDGLTPEQIEEQEEAKEQAFDRASQQQDQSEFVDGFLIKPCSIRQNIDNFIRLDIAENILQNKYLIAVSQFIYWLALSVVIYGMNFFATLAVEKYRASAMRHQVLKIVTPEQIDYANTIVMILSIGGSILLAAMLLVFAMTLVAATNCLYPKTVASKVLIKNIPGVVSVSCLMYAVCVIVERYYAHYTLIAYENILLGHDYFNPTWLFILLRLYLICAFLTSFVLTMMMSLKLLPGAFVIRPKPTQESGSRTKSAAYNQDLARREYASWQMAEMEKEQTKNEQEKV